MKKRVFLISLLAVFMTEAAVLCFLLRPDTENTQDAVLVNEIVQSVQEDWDAIENHKNRTDADYVVLALDGTVLFRTKSGLSESINQAVIRRDTILDIKADDLPVGKLIIHNDSERKLQTWRETCILVLLASMAVQFSICAGYMIYLDRVLIKPFYKLKDFARRIAGGNLDIPLEMDRKNLFGAFTESFDLMRTELKKARQAEAQANASKKELVAKLSHDIKTPVASIRAVSEVGAALTEDERIRDNYARIIGKADQINTLVSNLFTATLQELRQLSVTPEDMDSRELKGLLENADYLHRAEIPDIPGCMVYADRLRLQQVFDNIFANSYKYADTPISVTAALQEGCLTVCIEDLGGGVSAEELLLIKEKFRRGANAENVEGAGLGLYIADYFMKEMKGGLDVQNGEKGLRVSAVISLYGVI